MSDDGSKMPTTHGVAGAPTAEIEVTPETIEAAY